MSTVRWVGKALKQAQVNTITPANVGVGNIFNTIINGKTIPFTATAGTVANVTAGAVTENQDAAANNGEFGEVTWEDSTTLVTATASEAGKPFTQTSSASGGTATFTTATTVANSSPNDANDAVNYDGGALPISNDTLNLDTNGIDLLWNLGSLSAVTLTAMNRRFDFTGKIGLPEYDTTGYFQYRATEFAISATTALIEQPASDEAEHIKLNFGAAQTALTVKGEGGGSIGSEQLWWRGTHASNVVNLMNASMACALKSSQTAVIATLTAEGSTFRGGTGVTLTTINALDSTFDLSSNVATFTQRGDASELTCHGTMTMTTLNAYAGKVVHKGTGTITTLALGAGAEIDFSEGVGALTITNAITMNAGAIFWDPQGRTTQSAGFTLAAGVALSDVVINVGPGRTVTIS